MDVLSRFSELRPDDDYIDGVTLERIWSQVTSTTSGEIRKYATTSGIDEVDRRLQPPFVAIEPRGKPQRRSFAVIGAAAVIVVLGLGSIAIFRTTRVIESSPAAPQTDQSPSTADPETGSAPSATSQQRVMVGMTLPALPDGLALLQSQPEPTMRAEQSAFQVRVYGAIQDPQDPAQMIRVEYGGTRAMAIPCHSFLSLSMPNGPVEYSSQEWMGAATPIADSTPFAVADTTGSYCVDADGLLQAGWFTGDIGVGLSAGAGVTPSELVALAETLRSVPPSEPAPGRPSVDLAADPLPVGRVALVSEDVPFTQHITETSWVATVGGVDGAAGQLIVQTWQGADEQGVYAKLAPIQAKRVTVRGHDGYAQTFARPGESRPLEVRIWWTEAPGLVVSVWATELFDLDELSAIIEQLTPVDLAEYNQFIGIPDK